MTIPSETLHRPSIPVELDCGGLPVQGFSIGGLATYFMVPEWRLCFDMGECPVEALRMNNVFLTHSHGDHARGLLRHFSLRRMLNIPPAVYYVPEPLVEPLRRLAKAWAELEGHRHRVAEYTPQFEGVATRGRIELNRQTRVDAFPVEHRVRSLGYTVSECRKKLLPEFAEVPGHELGRLKREGVAIEREIIKPRLTFIGDSTLRTLEREPHVLESDILVIETTFLWDEDREMAGQKGHLHIDELMGFLDAHRDDCRFSHLVLKHFSMKYTRAQIMQAVARRSPDWLGERIQLLI